MKAQYFIYTRNLHNDYKLVYAPSDDFCSPEIRRIFLKQARGVINIETYITPLTTPRWLFVRVGNRTLFGVGTQNSTLSNINNSDYTGTPVRGFFGFVFDNQSEIEIPYDLDFFRQVYDICISPLWNCQKEEFKKKGVSVNLNLDKFTLLEKHGSAFLNVDSTKCVIWGNLHTEKSLLEAVLMATSDTSAVTNLGEKQHAFDAEYRFLNALVSDIDEKEERVFKTESNMANNPLNNNRPRTDRVLAAEESTVRPKKDYRPKIMMLIGIIAIVLIVIAMCSRGTQTSKHTTSGEKAMKQNPNFPNQLSDTLLIKQKKQPN